MPPRRRQCEPPSRQRGAVFVYFVILLAMLAAVATVYRYYHIHSQELEATHLRIADLGKLVDEAGLEAQRQQRQFESGMSRMAAIETAVEAIPSLEVGRASARLSLSEAEHLLQAAEWQLRLYLDSQAAIFALEKAHTRLDAFRDDRALERIALSVRRLISVLNTLQRPDIEGVLRDTQRLQNRILLLPPVKNWEDEELARIYSVAPLTEAAPDDDAVQPGSAEDELAWHERLWAYVVDVRPATLLGHLSLDSHNQTVLWENLLLLVSRVQSAALHANQEIYNTALQDILDLVHAAYPGDIKQKTAVVQLIIQMQGEVVAVNLPDLEQVRESLASAIDNYDKRGDRRASASGDADGQR